MRFRKLRIAWLVVCGIACVLLIALWVRSYWLCEGIVIPSTNAIVTSRGEIIVVRDSNGAKFSVVEYHCDPPLRMNWSEDTKDHVWNLGFVRGFDMWGTHYIEMKI